MKCPCNRVHTVLINHLGQICAFTDVTAGWHVFAEGIVLEMIWVSRSQFRIGKVATSWASRPLPPPTAMDLWFAAHPEASTD